MNEPKLSLEEAKEVVATKTAPRVTEASIKDRILTAEYLYYGLLTICVIKMTNGFMVHGVSAAASPANHDADVGRRYAFDNAFKQLWQLEGYLLREKLATSARHYPCVPDDYEAYAVTEIKYRPKSAL